MTDPSREFREDDLQVLRRLPALVLREGYIDAYHVFGPLHARYSAVRRQLEAVPAGPMRTLVELFFLGDTVGPDHLAALFAADEVDALVRLGVLHRDGEGVHSGKRFLLPAAGHLMLVPLPAPNPAIYFGDDSVALLIRVSPPRGGTALDLCSGPGIQALHLSSGGGRVVAVEINPDAARQARINVALNSLEDHIEVRQGDLYGAVRDGEKFDRVTANPPLLPFVPDLAYPFVGHGGGDALDVTRKIMAGLPTVLTEEGAAHIIGTCVGDERGPHPQSELERYARDTGLHVVWTIPTRLPLQPGSSMFEGLCWTCSTAIDVDNEVVRNRFAEHLAALKATHLYMFFLTISRGAGAGHVETTTHYRTAGGFWFR